jgi:hypothetical protein
VFSSRLGLFDLRQPTNAIEDLLFPVFLADPRGREPAIQPMNKADE